MSPTSREALPEPKGNRQFPVGDVDANAALKAHLPLEMLKAGTHGDQRDAHRLLRGFELRAWLASDTYDAYGSILSITRAWAMEQQRSEEWAHDIRRVGAGTIIAFNRRTHLMPLMFDDFSSELAEVQRRPSAEFVHLYAREAWRTMRASHPNLHAVLQPLVEHAIEVHTDGIDPHRDRDAVFASAALPYQLAAATRLLSYYHAYDDERISREIDEWQVP